MSIRWTGLPNPFQSPLSTLPHKSVVRLNIRHVMISVSNKCASLSKLFFFTGWIATRFIEHSALMSLLYFTVLLHSLRVRGPKTGPYLWLLPEGNLTIRISTSQWQLLHLSSLQHSVTRPDWTGARSSTNLHWSSDQHLKDVVYPAYLPFVKRSGVEDSTRWNHLYHLYKPNP